MSLMGHRRKGHLENFSRKCWRPGGGGGEENFTVIPYPKLHVFDQML